MRPLGIRISTSPLRSELVTLYTTPVTRSTAIRDLLIVVETTAVLAFWTSPMTSEGHLLKQGYNVKSINQANTKIIILVANLTDIDVGLTENHGQSSETIAALNFGLPQSVENRLPLSGKATMPIGGNYRLSKSEIFAETIENWTAVWITRHC
jgi:hypothetical protein